MRKIFLSFLGTNEYVRCNYSIGSFTDRAQQFIQVSLLRMLATDFAQSDKAIIFLTDEARIKNWDADPSRTDRETGSPLSGLGTDLTPTNTGFQGQITTHPITNGYTEAEVWDVFQTVYDSLEEGDEVYLDITHAFRYFPMLSLALLNYARALKKVSVAAIYYGAFERLGPAYQVRDHMPMEARNAEILNLVAFDRLQLWTEANKQFVDNGNATMLRNLADQDIRPMLRNQNGDGIETIKTLNTLTKNLRELTDALSTNRGKVIAELDYEYKILSHLKSLESGATNPLPPFRPLLRDIRKQVEPFAKSTLPTWLTAANYCFEKGLYQQSITQLQEGLMTQVIYDASVDSTIKVAKRDNETGVEKLLTLSKDPYNQSWREMASQAFTIASLADSSTPWREPSKSNVNLSIELQQLPVVRELHPKYKKLEGLRNDISHGGYTKPTTADRLVNALREVLDSINLFYSSGTFSKQEGKLPPIFINHSNHPTSTWASVQTAAAAEWGNTMDLPFPNVPPDASAGEVARMAEDAYQMIIEKTTAYKPTVHLMGELTYTHYLVHRLKASGITCVASTTERDIAILEDGRTTSTFHFVAFREY